MSEIGNDQVPLSFKARKFIDGLRDGFSFTEYYHRKPINIQRAEKLYDKLGKKGLNSKEGALLQEYERAQLYQKYPTDGKVLNLASGSDALPATIYGEKNVAMLSLEHDRYFPPYEQYRKGFEQVPKVEADMEQTPFAPESFSNVLLNGFYSLNAPLISEIKRVLKSGGYLIMTANGSIQGVNAKMIDEPHQEGLEIKKYTDYPTLHSLVIKKL